MPRLPRGERTPFLEFQARNRRATWRLTAACAVVVGGGGVLSAIGFLVNVALVLFALVFIPSVVLLGLAFLASLGPATAALRDPLLGATSSALRGLDLLTGLWPGEQSSGLLVFAGLLTLGAWLAVRSVWLTAGVGAALLAMGARAPTPGDLEEHQLVNVVQEMAIAAGIPAPQVRLLDASVANAAAAGTGLDESYLVVGRRLLDEFDREETQGILGHLVGSIGNGDLRGAAQIHSLLYLLELLIVVVLAPFAASPRRVAWKWLTFPLWAPFHSREARAEGARALIRLLEEHRAILRIGDGDARERLGHGYLGRIGAVLVRACPPFIALILLTQVATAFLLLFASLPVALLWRSRRYLADATAVQLTRNPTGLYRALGRLAECGAVLPGSEAVAHLFVVGPEAIVGRKAFRGRPGPGPAEAPEGSAPEAGPATERGSFWEREGFLMGMHPPLSRRLRRLVRMGAVPREEPA